MATIPTLESVAMRQIALLLGEKLLPDGENPTTGTQITNALNSLNIKEFSQESTKWKRINDTFTHYQKKNGNASKLFDFIKALLHPAGFTNNPHAFEDARQELNAILAFYGVEYGEDGKFRASAPVKTIEESRQRAEILQAKFTGRYLHRQVKKYCEPELLQKSYFHAVSEAIKGLAQRIRELSSLSDDGETLIDKVFSATPPILTINAFVTDSEKSEHRGFALLLKGCFAAFRNPPAHTPRILCKEEDDAADCLSFISLLHERLDRCVPTGLNKES